MSNDDIDYTLSLESDATGDDGTLFDNVNKLTAQQTQFIAQQLFKIIDINHQKNKYFLGLNPLMVKLTLKNGLYYPVIDVGAQYIDEFEQPPEITDNNTIDIYCLGLVAGYMLLKEQAYCPQVSLGSKVYKYIGFNCIPDSAPIGGSIYSKIDVKKFRYMYELICFIEACTGNYGAKIRAIYSLEQLRNHVYMKGIKVPLHILNTLKSEGNSKNAVRFSKFVFTEGGLGTILFSTKPKQNGFNKDEWFPYYLIKMPKGTTITKADMFNKYYGVEIIINEILYQAKAPNVLTSFASKSKVDSTSKKGLFRIYIQYQEGLSLTKYCDESIQNSQTKLRSNVSEMEIQTIMKDVAIALQGIHKSDVMFRDLNPSNVIVYIDNMGEMHAKIIDFGVSSLQEQADTVVGTQGYKAPEIKDNGVKQLYDKRIDIYAFGSLLFYLLTLTMDDPKLPALKMNGSKGISIDILDLLEGCIQEDANDRPFTFDEILQHPFFKSTLTNKIYASEIIINKRTRRLHGKYIVINTFNKYPKGTKQ
jgi:serine/threonine protein kinase